MTWVIVLSVASVAIAAAAAMAGSWVAPLFARAASILDFSSNGLGRLR
jgi:hypothetical protein